MSENVKGWIGVAGWVVAIAFVGTLIYSGVQHIKERDAIRATEIAYRDGYTIGTVVEHKTDGRRGTICGYGRRTYRNKNGAYMFYVRFSVRAENVHGMDTAAGSGVLGSVKHFEPTLYVTVLCHRQELTIVR